MILLSITEMLINARKEHYAVGAFNVLNLEMFQAIVNAAEAEKSRKVLMNEADTLAGSIAGKLMGRPL